MVIGLNGLSLGGLFFLSHKLGKKIENFDQILGQFKELNLKLEKVVKNQSLRSSIRENEFSNERQNLLTQFTSLMKDLERIRTRLC